jgi:alanine racemase
MSPLTWVEVDLAAIQHNLKRMQAFTGTRVMAVVKANAYGHGAVEVARAAQQAGADWLGVARAEDGLALRAAGLHVPILVMGYTPPDDAVEAIGADLALTLFDLETAQAYAGAARALNRPVRVHIKVETGMGRLGVLPESAPEFVRAVRALDALQVEGIFTHFANADFLPSPVRTVGDRAGGEGEHSAHAQLATFNAVLAALPFRPPLVHACNSAGAFAVPEAHFDLVRIGIALYGLNPSESVPCPRDFRAALSWKARVIQVKTLPPGHGVSYGSQYVTRTAETVAIVAAGYADGFRRVMNVNEVLIRGQRAPVRGRVCMDQVVVGVSHLPGVRAGDEAVLIGQQGEARITADDLARKWGTINYEATSGIMERVARVYTGKW